MNWLEISFTLDGDLAEAVTEVFNRYAPQGVWIDSTALGSDLEGEGRPAGPVRVRAFLPADEPAALDATRARLEQDLFSLGTIQPLPKPVYAQVEFDDYRGEQWRASYKPVRISERLVVVPAWLHAAFKNSPESKLSDIHLLMEPGVAFGTGTHTTTQQCLVMLERFVRPGDAVLDIGCGSGILSVAAAKLGAARVLAVDLDSDAVATTRQNAALNGVADRIDVRPGSLELVRADPSRPTFDVTVVNIIARVIIKLVNEGLGDTLTLDSRLILSGILDHQAEAVIAALDAAGIMAIEQQHAGEWVTLAARRVSA